MASGCKSARPIKTDSSCRCLKTVIDQVTQQFTGVSVKTQSIHMVNSSSSLPFLSESAVCHIKSYLDFHDLYQNSEGKPMLAFISIETT